MDRIEFVIEGTEACPICGAQTEVWGTNRSRDRRLDWVNTQSTQERRLDRLNGNTQSKAPRTYKQVISELEENRISELAKASSAAFVEQAKSNAQKPTLPISKDSIDIPVYLNHLIGIEANLSYFQQHLNDLLMQQTKVGKRMVKESLWAAKIAAEKTDMEISRIHDEIAALAIKYQPIPPSEFDPSKFGLIPPEMPTFQKAGLFHKRKIEAQNQVLQNQYDTEKQEYDLRCQQLKAAEEAKCQKQNEEIAAKKALEEKEWKDQLLALESQKESPKEPSNTKTTSQAVNAFLLGEIQEAKDKISELCNARGALLSLNVVYPKYLDIIALATISEYFESGRVSVLDGASGAYNLYENELRANLIIAQLDQVLVSLEEIKQNQYKVFSVLQSIDRQLSSIHSQLHCAVASLSNIDQTAKKIEANTEAIANNTEIIAYQTAKTAQYAKIDAELTNALGFMTALR